MRFDAHNHAFEVLDGVPRRGMYDNMRTAVDKVRREFRAVAVMACDDEVVPLQQRIDEVSDEADLKEAFNTERHLFYLACTRAGDRLLVTGVEPASEFLADLVELQRSNRRATAALR